MAFSGVPSVAAKSLRLGFRSFSQTAKCLIGMKERIHNFVAENPHLSPKASSSLNVPVTKGVSKMQKEMLQQIELIDVDAKPLKLRQIRPNSKENPLLVGSDLERKVETCLCYPDVHYMRHIVLYRDLPMRCQCGHWFKLVDMERFELEREKRWQEIKDQPENVKLLQELTDAENELNRLMEKGKSVKPTSRGSDDLLEALANQWERLKTTYAKIRRNMDLP